MWLVSKEEDGDLSCMRVWGWKYFGLLFFFFLLERMEKVIMNTIKMENSVADSCITVFEQATM